MQPTTKPKHTPEGTEGPWHVSRNHAEGEDPRYDTFDVLAPNPDAGKTGVCYAGKYLSVCQLMDNEADAARIVLCVNSHDALVEVLEYLLSERKTVLWLTTHNPLALKMARAALADAKVQP